MTVYIIGPISGKPDANKRAFFRAYGFARLRWPEAHVIIPHDLYIPSAPAYRCPALRWCEAMCACIPVARSADIIVALSDWRSSPGARVEERERTGRLIEETDIS
jgi:hypothetical protein